MYEIGRIQGGMAVSTIIYMYADILTEVWILYDVDSKNMM